MNPFGKCLGGRAGHALLAAAIFTATMSQAQSQPVIKFATTLPPSSPPVAEFWEPWGKRVNDAAGGAFQFQIVNGPTLANGQNVYERTVSGVTEAGWGILGALGAPFPKSTLPNLPFVVDSAEIASVALWRIYAAGLIADEFRPVKVLGFIATPPSGLHSKVPIARLADVKGMKIRSADKISSDTIAALGASPISLAAAEMYQGLATGVVGALLTPWTGIGSFKIQEVATDHLEVSLGAVPGAIFMNLDAYNKLSATGKAAIDGNSGEAFTRAYGAWFDGFGVRFREMVKAMPGHTLRSLDAAENQAWNKAVSIVIAQWAERTPNGATVLAAYRAEVDKLKK